MNYLQILLILIFAASCKPDGDESYKGQLYNAEFFHRSLKKLTDIMVYDILSPPVATRNYTYPTVAAYEILSQAYPEYQSLAGQLNGLDPITPYDTNTHVDPYLAALEVFTILGHKLVFSEGRMDEFRQTLEKEWMEIGVTTQVLNDSRKYANQVAAHFFEWMSTDNYKQTRTMPKYPVNPTPGRWEPTPPGYIDGIEPHWNKIRTMVLKSADQFSPPLPPPFDTIPGSKFYQVAMEVYDSTKLNDEEYIKVASFWDCNPFVLHSQGHVLYSTKKISPGGHWLGITGIAAQKSNLDPMATIHAYTWVAIGMWDSFISCWDAKYESNLVRPETYINKYIDPLWRPLLQTPPFPEHTSGHSVVSQTSAVILTALFGDHFEYDDTIEMEYGLPMRHFSSFLDAASEAAISRLYGGIHYRPAIGFGVKQGDLVGHFLLKNLVTKNRSIALSH